MTILALSRRVISIKRRTAFIVDAETAVASHAIDRQPTRAAHVQVTVSGGTDDTGTVTISGTVDGSSDSEVLTFTAGGSKTTAKRFSAFTTIATSGLADETVVPTLSAKMVGSGGSPEHLLYSVVVGWRAHLEHGRASWPSPVSGTTEQDLVTVIMAYTNRWTPREGDIITDELANNWMIIGTPMLLGIMRQHHWEMRAVRKQGANV